MIQLKQSVAARAPVRLLDVSGSPVTGVVAGGITSATLYYAGGTTSSVTVSGNWNETAGGGYQLTITPTVLGPVQLVVVAAAASTFVGVYDVVADFASDGLAQTVTSQGVVTTAVSAATTAANAAAASAAAADTSASGAVTAANAAAASAAAALSALTGGWTLNPTLNQLVMYAADNVTVIATFNCFNASGTPSVTDVYQRVRV